MINLITKRNVIFFLVWTAWVASLVFLLDRFYLATQFPKKLEPISNEFIIQLADEEQFEVLNKLVKSEKELQNKGYSLLKAILKEVSTVRSKLSGEKIYSEKGETNVIAVMVENSVGSRNQQYGLSKASIVYHTQTEGEVTRYMALYSHQDVDKIGPIRSSRSCFLDWLAEYSNPLYAHAGGSPEAMNIIPTMNIRNIDEDIAQKNLYRDYKYSKPHNLYTDTNRLKTLAKNNNWEAAQFDARFIFTQTEQPLTNPSTTEIILDYSLPAYKVRYIYNPENNSYLREVGGYKHIDKLDNSQINPKNIIIQLAEYSIIPGDDQSRLQFQNIGSGKVFLLQNGNKTEGTWKKASFNSKTIYYDENGEEISLNPGQTFIEIIDPDQPLTFK